MRVRRYWLVKSEPDSFSWDDLWSAPERTTAWEGVRNYQARNLLRDMMQKGDLVFFYHSSAVPPSIMGVAEVMRAGYPDPTAFDRKSEQFDPKSDPASPVWYAVDIKARRAFRRPITLSELRLLPELQRMVLLQKGSRLSVQPVSPDEWEVIYALGTREGD
jgi:predicted RNA-binding protein with PUA-like domain